jgi:hypothetical protein
MDGELPELAHISRITPVGQAFGMVHADAEPRRYTPEEYGAVLTQAHATIDQLRVLLLEGMHFSTQQSSFLVLDPANKEEIWVSSGFGGFDAEEHFEMSSRFIAERFYRFPEWMHRPLIHRLLGIVRCPPTLERWEYSVDRLGALDFADRDAAILQIELIMVASVEGVMTELGDGEV